MTSQYEEFSRNDTAWSALLYKCANAKYEHKLARLDIADARRHAGAGRGDGRLCARMRDGRAGRRARARSARAAPADATRTATRTQDMPFTSKQLRECYRKGAAAFGWAKRNPEPRSMRDGTRARRLGHGNRRLGSAADADGRPHRADGQRPAEVSMRHLRHRHRHLHDHGAGRGRHARPADRQRHGETRRFDAAALAGRRRVLDGGLGRARRSRPPAERCARTVGPCAGRCRTRRSPTPKLDDVVRRRQIVSSTDGARAVSIADAMRHGGVDRIEQEKTAEVHAGRASTPATPTRRSSPR